ncbi:DoxX family protein [Corynebacterium anserum]|uniref:DoxX family membrane protein n=1 Tax=Corynebacterium anserum TaxID=2684406 RepID=A0A7G7YPI0_9CORY|nr:DoxX family protein [Corynebacterium anserum]MBC2682029.1 DoxX family membrane protein [Corynebacterium anserum]QNH96400.1 DoxX family membrane protein [Corynebacterium anserum]
MNNPALRDAALLLLRVVAGVIFIAHGWHKAFVLGMDGPGGTTELYAAAGVPAPAIMAWFTAAAEMLGGALLVLGLLATASAAVLALFSLVTLYFFHWGHGFYAEGSGIEMPLILIAACVVIVVFGSGRASLDRVFSRFS